MHCVSTKKIFFSPKIAFCIKKNYTFAGGNIPVIIFNDSDMDTTMYIGQRTTHKTPVSAFVLRVFGRAKSLIIKQLRGFWRVKHCVSRGYRVWKKTKIMDKIANIFELFKPKCIVSPCVVNIPCHSDISIETKWKPIIIKLNRCPLWQREFG